MGWNTKRPGMSDAIADVDAPLDTSLPLPPVAGASIESLASFIQRLREYHKLLQSVSCGVFSHSHCLLRSASWASKIRPFNYTLK